MKIILFLASGLFGRPSELRDNMTALQLASTPFLDSLASKGTSGTFDPIAPGVPVDPLMSLYLMLGGQGRDYPGMGYYIAKANNLVSEKYDTFIDVRFARVKEKSGRLELEKVSPLMGEDVYKKIISGITSFKVDDYIFDFYYLGSGRGLLCTKKGSRFVSYSLPHEDGVPVKKIFSTLSKRFESYAAEVYKESKKFANALNSVIAMSYEKISSMKIINLRKEAGIPYANILLTASSGKHEKIGVTRQWLKPVCLSGDEQASNVILDLGFTLAGKWDGTKNLLEKRVKSFMKMDSRFMLIYYPNVREISSLGQIDAKKRAVEEVDKLIKIVAHASDEKTIFCVTSDSSILTAREGSYCGDSIPFHISGPGVHREFRKSFSEVELSSGGQGRISSTSLMDILLSYSNSIGSYFLGDKEDMLYSEGEESTFFIYKK